MRYGSQLHRTWQVYAGAATWVTGYRDKGMWPWRLVCWRAGRHDAYYGSCVICGKPQP